MSFLDRFRGSGGSKPRAGSTFDDSVDRSRLMAGGVSLGPTGLTLEFDNSRFSGGESVASSIISEATPAELPGGSARRTSPTRPAAGHGLPFIGGLGQGAQQAVLGGALGLGLLGLALVALGGLSAANEGATRTAAIGEALTQSQRMAKAASQSLAGSGGGFAELRDSAALLASTVRGLRSGSGQLRPAPEAVQPLLEPLLPLIDRAEKDANTLAAQQATLTQAAKALRSISRQSTELLALAEPVAVPRPDLSATEAAAAGRLLMLSQRIGKSAGELLAGVAPDAAASLGRDLDSLKATAEGLLVGSSELRLPGTKDPAARLQIQNLLAQFEKTRSEAAPALGGLQALTKAREAQARILADSEPLRTGLLAVQAQGQAGSALGPLLLAVGGLSLLLAALGGLGLFLLYAQDQRRRASLAEAQREEAERLEQQAKRVNDANQAAILRLMNELQTVAEGDLTQQATVTEDITGAIADSVNYTVEELRSLVAQVQGTVARVTDTTQQVEMTSTELLAASDEQLREIRETGESVLQMASRINEVSAQAGQSAQVARQSLVAAESGLQAVQNAIGGMNTLRDQIQDTSKRIKRLGESSQEIGEITELISDITEQTNVLALNAAIQAASAGEAGRGFSVVAEEVQRLAERSADATRQIAALVKAIQTDTQDAVAAMERSTQGVVEGARLSDSAGSALGEIDRVSRRLAELIERISAETSGEARSANVVASNIQHIFAVTEQTGEGTRSTAGLVRELSRMAEELKASVARFKIR